MQRHTCLSVSNIGCSNWYHCIDAYIHAPQKNTNRHKHKYKYNAQIMDQIKQRIHCFIFTNGNDEYCFEGWTPFCYIVLMAIWSAYLAFWARRTRNYYDFQSLFCLVESDIDWLWWYSPLRVHMVQQVFNCSDWIWLDLAKFEKSWLRNSNTK